MRPGPLGRYGDGTVMRLLLRTLHCRKDGAFQYMRGRSRCPRIVRSCKIRACSGEFLAILIPDVKLFDRLVVTTIPLSSMGGIDIRLA